MTQEWRKEARVIFFRGGRRKKKLGETEDRHTDETAK